MSLLAGGVDVGGGRGILQVLPRGQSLPEEFWASRHRAILVLLWIHAAAIPIYGLARGFTPEHSLLEGLVVPAAAVAASIGSLSRRSRTLAASMGLLTASAVLVHMSDGLIEMHFHFFVMVTVVALYQDWLPFLAAIGYVFVHHGVMGALAPSSVFNHPAALEHPWLWGGVHALFIAGISAVCLVTWRLNETIFRRHQVAEERVREEAQIVEALHEVGTALAAELSLDRVVQMVTDAATERTGAAFGAFFYNVVDDDGESFLLYALAGAPVEAFSKLGLPRNTDIFKPTFEGEGVVRSDDVTQDPRYGRLGPHFGMPEGHLPVRSYLAVPVRAIGGGVLGGLFFGHPEPGRFGEADERIVVGIASQAAIAFDNARLYESERQARIVSEASQARLGLLVEASQVLTTSLELHSILRGLAALVASTTADYCVIDVKAGDGAIARAAGGRGAERGHIAADLETVAPAAVLDSDVVMRVHRTGRSEVLDPAPPDVLGGGKEWPESDRPATAIVVPLVGRHEVLGVIILARVADSVPLGKDDLVVAEELARRASVAVENARLYDRQRSVAETLQHSLLPEHLPELPGIDVAARYRAGGPGVDIGGDWYDMLPLNDGRLMLAMGDVVGRGERAAALMGQLRNAARVYALDTRSPGQVVRLVNELIHQLGPGDMATMVCAVIDPEANMVTTASAGHPPPMVIRPDGEAEFLDAANGPPVGAVPGAAYAESVRCFVPGSTLVLYTDGLVEDRSTPLDEGLNRLRSSLTGQRGDLESLCDNALETLNEDCEDDIALLLVRVAELGDHLVMRLATDPSTLQPLRAALRRWLAGAGATEEETYEILVAAGEAAANAVRHTRWSNASHYEVEALSDENICIVVRDSGTWRPARDDGGGRGLQLMDEFMDHFEVAKSAGGTTVTMSRQLVRHRMQDVTA